ncbi:1-methyladenosine methyltransferase catalytic subunit Gcd14 [Zychaea mexicana]|uniref:1-methyladenosine methyltransferase catalytic subunit Gcd14 n=1 Tax=Zychaea mexicana TaxID=64656 RepID=UPI0022FE3602|nr:1-methyladenosine methyltransferase catalytic subunit Gcd14 [Zychaea mexicana]KAI9488550.1 1-methyladenosine methyltransferase catalytic subunit Gcd14 [Zychaea mexicana]
MISTTQRGFIYLLHPTPELWTLCLPHRTQILYIADISFISTYLDMKPGSHVIESGTGSGSFSHSIARTIAPTGKLYTFEYHAERTAVAAKEFTDHGLGEIVQIQQRDVCKDGFGMTNAVNAVFLDLPAPWEAIASAKASFLQHRTGKICTFSPCIEQVAKSVEALNENGFVEITMYECLVRSHDVSPIKKVDFAEAIQAARRKRLNSRKRPLEDGEEGASEKVSEIELSETISTMLVSKTPVDTRGHTSYLTFATFLPAIENNVEPSGADDLMETVVVETKDEEMVDSEEKV